MSPSPSLIFNMRLPNTRKENSIREEISVRAPYGLLFPVDCLENAHQHSVEENVFAIAYNDKFTNWILIKYFCVGRKVIVSRRSSGKILKLCGKKGKKVNGTEKCEKLHVGWWKLRHCRNIEPINHNFATLCEPRFLLLHFIEAF